MEGTATQIPEEGHLEVETATLFLLGDLLVVETAILILEGDHLEVETAIQILPEDLSVEAAAI